MSPKLQTYNPEPSENDLPGPGVLWDVVLLFARFVNREKGLELVFWYRFTFSAAWHLRFWGLGANLVVLGNIFCFLLIITVRNSKKYTFLPGLRVPHSEGIGLRVPKVQGLRAKAA